jgi:hypothetical protein
MEMFLCFSYTYIVVLPEIYGNAAATLSATSARHGTETAVREEGC